MSKRFYREDGKRHIRLGSRKKKITWRRPRGNQSKMRRNRKSYPSVVSIGYRTQKTQRKIQTVEMIVHTIKDLDNFKKGEIAILSSKVGMKKRMEIIKAAKEKGISFKNVGDKK